MTYESIDPQRIAELAHDLWRKRGCPIGSPEIDWRRAEELLAHDSGIYPALRSERAAANETLDANGFERRAHLSSAEATDRRPKVFVL
jgi:hypothetical protein